MKKSADLLLTEEEIKVKSIFKSRLIRPTVWKSKIKIKLFHWYTKVLYKQCTGIRLKTILKDYMHVVDIIIWGLKD